MNAIQRLAVASAIALAGLPTAGLAQQALDPEKLAYCMVAHSGDAEIAAMKHLLIAALQDDEAGLRAGVAELGGVMLRLAMSDCSVNLSQLEDPAFGVAAEKYGELLGARVMEAAFSKLQ